MVERLLRAAVPAAPQVQATLPSTPADHPWGYRHKVHFVFGAGRESTARPLAMGHYARGARRLVTVRECPVHDPRGNALAFAFADAVGGDSRGHLRSLAIRVGHHSPELMATLVVSRPPDKRLRNATERALRAAPAAPTSFYVNIHEKDDGLIFGRESRHIAGTSRMREIVGGVSFVVSPTAFFQTNVAAAELLVRLVLEAIPGNGSILDLYAGAGLFSLPLALRGSDVTAVEGNRLAVADAEASMRLNRVSPERCRFIAKPVEHAVKRLRSANAVVVDPPREGCSTMVMDEVFGRIRPPRAVYVSCNPEALARDAATALQHGYALRSIQPVDMFPHTAHVETVAVLDRISNPGPSIRRR